MVLSAADQRRYMSEPNAMTADQLLNHRDQLKAENDRLNPENDALRQQIAVLTASLQDATRTIHSLRSQNQAAVRTIETLKAELAVTRQAKK
jgi:cell division protein FtsB